MATPAQAPQTAAPDVFDQVAGQTAPGPSSAAASSQATGNGSGDIFDQLAAGNTNAANGQPTDSATAPPAPAPRYYSPAISAVPQPTSMAGRLERWADNVSHDLQYGTDLTGVGSVLKSMGAHGVYNGNPQAVGDALASLPLGAAKTVQGAAELAQSGKRVQGMKDTAGGLLQASTIPASFVAPEAGELASEGVGTGARAAAKGVSTTAGKLTASFNPNSVQEPLQQALRDTVSNVAREAGVPVNPASSVRDVAESVADAILTKSKGIYAKLDAATGNASFQRFDQALFNVNRALRETVGLDDEGEAALVKRKGEIEAAQQTAFDQARAAGVDPKLIDEASGTYKQAQALYDMDHGVKMSTRGLRPELAMPGSAATPETVTASTAFQRFNRLYDSGRLQQAVGSERAGSLLQQIDQAFVQEHKIATRVKALKTAAKITGTGAAIGAVGEGAHLVKDAVQ